MNISKIGAVSFNGYLMIQHQNGTNCFDAKKIDKAIVNGRKSGVLISGKDIEGKYTRVHIPYYAISQDKVLSAYSAARKMEKATVILKTDEKCLVKSR